MIVLSELCPVVPGVMSLIKGHLLSFAHPQKFWWPWKMFRVTGTEYQQGKSFGVFFFLIIHNSPVSLLYFLFIIFFVCVCVFLFYFFLNIEQRYKWYRKLAWNHKQVVFSNSLSDIPKGGRGCLMSPPPPLLWNLRADVWFHFTISSFVLLLTPLLFLSCLCCSFFFPFFFLLAYSPDLFSPEKSSIFFWLRDRLFLVWLLLSMLDNWLNIITMAVVFGCRLSIRLWSWL